MKTKSLLITAGLLFGVSNFTYAQFGPFSNNTVNAASCETVAPKKIEIQITPVFANSSRYFDADGKSQKIEDQILYDSDMSMQMTIGVVENLEIGVSVPFNASALSVGMKYNFLNPTEKFKVAAGAWTDINTSTRVQNTNDDVFSDEIMTGGAGLIFQYALTEKSNLYFDIFGQSKS